MQIIELSQRNLLTLLHKLTVPGSAATLQKPTPDGYVMIHAVADEVAYKDRNAGPMSPDTEQFVAEMKAFLALREAEKNYKKAKSRENGQSAVFAAIYGGGKV